MNRRTSVRASALALLAVGVAACSSLVHRVPYDGDALEAEVMERVRAFEAAERTRDPEAVLAFLWHDFEMLQDGLRVTRAETARQMRSVLPGLRRFEPRFDDVRIRVVGPRAAVSSMTFFDRITDASGVVTESSGPSTLVWEKRHGEWRISFADSDHYPADTNGDDVGWRRDR